MNGAGMISFTILGQCVSMKNRRQLVTIAGRPQLIKSKDALAYERAAMMQIPVAAKQMLEGPLRITMHLFYASERPDLDGAILLDIMAAEFKNLPGPLIPMGNGEFAAGPAKRTLIRKGVYLNNRQCREIHQYHHINRVNPRAEIEIEALAPQQAPLIGDVPQEREFEGDPF